MNWFLCERHIVIKIIQIDRHREHTWRMLWSNIENTLLNSRAYINTIYIYTFRLWISLFNTRHRPISDKSPRNFSTWTMNCGVHTHQQTNLYIEVANNSIVKYTAIILKNAPSMLVMFPLFRDNFVEISQLKKKHTHTNTHTFRCKYIYLWAPH